jgi:hypothetical protein
MMIQAMEMVLVACCSANGVPRFASVEGGKRRSRGLVALLKDLDDRRILPTASVHAARSIIQGTFSRGKGNFADPNILMSYQQDHHQGIVETPIS